MTEVSSETLAYNFRLNSILLQLLSAERFTEVPLVPPFRSGHESSVRVTNDGKVVELIVSDFFDILNTADEASVAKVEVAHAVYFTEVEGLEPGSAIEKELVVEARLVTYPIMRERLMSTVVAMGMPALVLPIVTRAELISSMEVEADSVDEPTN